MKTASSKLQHAKLWRYLGYVFIAIGVLVCAKTVANYAELGSDFLQDYAAAKALRAGKSIYGPAIGSISKEFVAKYTVENFHPPFNALMFHPLTLLDFRAAFIAWGGLSLLWLFLLIRTICTSLGLSKTTLVLTLGLSLNWYPVIYCMGTGQSSLLISLLIILGWKSLREERETSAGILIGIACSIKLFPALIGLVFLVRRQYRAVAWLISAFVTCHLAVLMVGGYTNITEYYSSVVQRDIQEWQSFVLNCSLRGFLSPLLISNGWIHPLVNSNEVYTILLTGSSLLVVSGLYLTISREWARGHGIDLS